MHINDIKCRRSYMNDNISDLESYGRDGLLSSNTISSTVLEKQGEKDMHEDGLKYRWRSWFKVGILVLLWYSFAIVAITSSKKIMIHTPLPFLLCCSQFAIAAVLTRLYLHFNQSLKTIQASFNSLVRQISVSYTFGFIFTNIAFSMVNANFAETVKAGEPISTVALGLIYLREETSWLTYLTLAPICSGVAISCFHDDSFHVYGFIYALLSNFCFSTRAVIAKRLNIHHKGSMDEISLFYHISRIGLLILIPAMLWLEGQYAVKRLVYEFSAEDAEILVIMVVNGAAYTLYNILSFLVLSRTNLITHAVLNVFRRVFIILFTVYYFDVRMSSFNLLGIFIAVVGVLSFAYSKSRDNSANNK